MEIISWVKNNFMVIVQIYLAVVGLASIIVKLTPTLKDDDFLLGVVKFVGKYIAIDKYGPAEVKRPV